MKHSEFSLKLKSPCPARWNEMIPDQKGRYCSSCSKNVIDFTTLTDAQVLEIIAQSSANICGRLRQDQVNRVIMVRNQQSLYSRLFTFFTGLLFLGSIESLIAQQSDKTQQTSVIRSSYQREDVQRNEKQSSVKDSIIVSGQILDEISNEILIGASVYVKGRNYGKVTDVEGKFTFTIAEMNFPENDSLLITYTGYNKKEIKINPDYKTELKILMFSLPFEYGLIGLVEYKCSPKLKWWQWNKKRLFSKDSKH